MWPFRKKEIRESIAEASDILLKALIGNGEITKEQALSIPAVSSCVELISSTVASLPVFLYREEDGKVTTIEDDRVNLINDDTGDTLDGYQFKKAWITDYLLNGTGFAYINRERNAVKSLHYVDYGQVSIKMNTDPIFKSYDILVYDRTYREFEFLKITRNTKDGVTGKGILKENNKMLSVVYNSLVFEEVLVKTGGNKKGFLKSQSRLSDDAIRVLKEAWNNLYKNNTESVVVLNNGVEFQEASNTSVEMQLNENKKTNANEIYKMFLVPPSILDGTANDMSYNNWVKICILPILSAIQTALNKDLLLPSEKGSFYFAFDTKDLLKGDIEKRFKAYEIASKNGFMQIDEIRYLEDLEPLGLNFIKLGLQDVLYNPATKKIYTPNTNKTADMANPDTTLEGGETDENRNPWESSTA